EGHVEVVIPEGRVLLGVENFQQGRGRVSPEVVTELVDLVQHEDGVLRLGAAKPLNDLARQSADVRAPVSPDLGLVPHAAEGDPVNFRPRARAIERPREVLPTPGGPTKHRIGAFPSGRSFRTARCSRMRSLTFSRPQWSSSRMARARIRSMSS